MLEISIVLIQISIVLISYYIEIPFPGMLIPHLKKTLQVAIRGIDCHSEACFGV